MAVPNIRSELAAATTLLDLATRLGTVCLEHSGKLEQLRERPGVRAISENLEGTVAAIDPQVFLTHGHGGFMHLLGLYELEWRLGLAEMHPPIEYLGFLRGLCHKALPRWFVRTEDRLTLRPGMPVPVPARSAVFEDRTPAHATMARTTLLENLPFRLFDAPRTRPITIDLDYSSRDLLEEVTWPKSFDGKGAEHRLPRVATIHPPVGADGFSVTRSRESATFFDVRPRRWDLHGVLERLRSATGRAEIAVLPELSVPADAVDELASALAQDPHRYPRLVVAGSAHVRSSQGGDAVRANEARVYLEGELVACAAKIHPFATKQLGALAPEQREDPDEGKVLVTEAITGGPKTITVLACENTHLAVVICSDLNCHEVPAVLEAANVNLLLVPSMTPTEGAFNGALGGLASRCQGMCLVVNADLDPFVSSRRERPFRVMASIPRAPGAHQSRSYPTLLGPWRSLGIFDPNHGLWRAMSWR